MTDPSKFNINIGEVRDSTVTIGDYNTVVQNNRISPEEAAELKSVFEGLRSEVAEKAPPEERDEALGKTAELEEAVVAPEPDPGRVKRVLGWFKEHAPELAGSVVSVVVHPLIGKIVEGAGEAIAARLREAVEEAG